MEQLLLYFDLFGCEFGNTCFYDDESIIGFGNQHNTICGGSWISSVTYSSANQELRKLV